MTLGKRMKFTDFKFKDYIQEALKEINFIEATEVQEKLILIVLAGRDLSVNLNRIREDPYFPLANFFKP